MVDEKSSEDQEAVDASDVNDGDDSAGDDKTFDSTYVKKLRKEVIKWKQRAGDNLDKSSELEKRLVDTEKSAGKALTEVSQLKDLAERRLVSAEIKLISAELGLKKQEYAKLADNSKIRVHEDGSVTGVKEMLEELKSQDPDLFKMPTTTNINFTSSMKADSVKNKNSMRGLSQKEYEAKERQFLRSLRK